MNYILRDLASTQKYKSFKEKLKNKSYPVEISGLVPVAKTELIGALYEEERTPICIITYNEMQAKELEKNLSYFANTVEYFPKRGISIYDYDAESNEQQSPDYFDDADENPGFRTAKADDAVNDGVQSVPAEYQY